MKRIFTSSLLAIAALLLVTSVALACHIGLNAHAPGCEKIHINGTYFGNKATNKVEIYLDGNLVDSNVSFRNVTATFNGSASPGDHTVLVKGFELKGNWWSGYYWKLMATKSEVVSVDACYVPCSETTTTYGPWSEWVFDLDTMTFYREREVFFNDIKTGEVCYTDIEREGDEYTECSEVKVVDKGGDRFWIDVNTGKVCKTRCIDRWVEMDFGLFKLEGPDGQHATMYVYRQENGEFPSGISVSRQRCVLGWVAVNTSYFGVVYRNPCTGEYLWDGMIFMPRQDVVRDGVCDRSQPCR